MNKIAVYDAKIVMAIEKPTMPTCVKHKRALTKFEGEFIAEDGKTKTYFEPFPPIKPHTKLIPVADCEAAIAELEYALRPMLYDQAEALARQVMARYPHLKPHDVEGFVFEATRVYAQHPADLGAKANELLLTKTFPVNVPEINVALEPLAEARKSALNRARAHLAEHKRRGAAEAEPKQETEEERQAGLHQLYAGMYKAAGMDVPTEGELTMKRFQADCEDVEKEAAAEDKATLTERKAEMMERCKAVA